MVKPFDYQIECLSKIREVRAAGGKKAFIVMASGLGKTITTALDVLWFERQINRKVRMLFLCHKNEILEQAAAAYAFVHGEGRSVGFFHGQDRFGHSADFVFASLQTMAKRHHHFRQDEFDYVVVDESHHSRAETFEKVIKYWRPQFLLAVTATPDRIDGENVRDLYGPEIFHLPLETALVRGLLTPVDYRLMSDEIDLEKVLGMSSGTRWSISALNKHIFVPKRDEEIMKIIRSHMVTIENPRVIIFCTSVRHADRIAEMCDDAVALHSKVPTRERNIRMELFRQGIVPIVTSIDVFNEGVDVPKANLIVFLRSTCSPTIFFQQLGRGLRKSAGKDKVIVLDFAGNCERIREVQKLQQAVQNEWKSLYGGKGMLARDRATPQPFILNNEGFNFDERIVRVLDIITRAYNRSLYPTWGEASKAAMSLGIQTSEEYPGKFKQDPRLPSSPHQTYADWPGWNVFLNTVKYDTCSAASAAARALGFSCRRDYESRWREDRQLPANPAQFYPDFPGWRAFLSAQRVSRFFPTWQEASAFCREKGISSHSEYKKFRRQQPDESRKLPAASGMGRVWNDFPGFLVFFGKA